MQKKLRHSKFKNTGILFELLTNQLTTDILSNKTDSSAKNLLFKYFKENTELSKEWRLYNLLLTEKIKNETQAERFLSIIVEQRKKLSNKKLAEEKYNLIKEIKELYPIDEFLKSNIRNYKTMASIYKLFEDSTTNNIKFDVNEIYKAKTCIVEGLSGNESLKPQNSESEDAIKIYQQQSEDIRLLSYKLLIEGLNKKYNVLDNDQKLILHEYINNVSNTNSMGTFLCNKIEEVKSKLLKESSSIKNNDVIKIKILEVTKQLDKVKPKNNIIRDNQIMSLLLSYELLKEIKKQTSSLKTAILS